MTSKSKLAFGGAAKTMPGTVLVDVVVFQEGDDFARRLSPSGRVVRGASLAEFRRMLGGDEGYIVDNVYRGERHFVSLAEYRDADPQKTRVVVSFKFIPQKPIPPEYQDVVPAQP